MNLLLISEITDGLDIPFFGAALEKHLESKHHPAVRAASLTAWKLLELALNRAGIHMLPNVAFEDNGKPVFKDAPLHFSLSHSESLAAALLSDTACAVDIQAVQNLLRDKLFDRCLGPEEKAQGCDFFECWTKKECLGKLSGTGLSAHPDSLNSLIPCYADYFRLYRLADTAGQEYVLAALCMNNEETHIQKIEPEELQ